ncbi:ferric reductase-like transmembrane domain-containing protein [Dactylosporangium sp. NPDC000521]|uniref:ferredoxin reductase family protein n=1 Tax=Dactylosporangium sp. NPDC000521 TaxID=3363975 RepID=UPI00367C7D75
MDIQEAVQGPVQGAVIPREFRRPYRRRQSVDAWRAVTIATFWLGLVATLLPWWWNTPAGFLRDPATSLTAVGRITGLVAGYVLLVQVLLMSRVGWLDRWLGARDLLHWHRDLGVFVVAAVLAHAAFTVLGYAKLERVGPAREIVRLLTVDKYTGMLGAFIGTGLLVALAVLALPLLRRRMSYEVWHLLHLTSYLVLMLSVGHQFAVGQEMSAPGFSRMFSLVLWCAVVAAVLWGRLFAPVRMNLRHRFRVRAVVLESPDMISIYIGGDRLPELRVRAGQFFRWRFLDDRNWWQAHPFSMSAAPNDDWLRLTVKVVGDHTAGLRRLRPGTRVFVEGPSGDFTADRRRQARALLIAGGSGIGPIRALLEELPPRTVVLYRARNAGELVFREELSLLAEARDAQVWYVTGGRDDPGPRRAFSPRGLLELVPDLTRRDVYLCGSAGLVDASVVALRRAGVPPRQIHLDPFEF